MQAVASYSFATCGWHLLQALPLIVWPQAINGLLTMDSEVPHSSTAVEVYFARSLGFALAGLGLVTVVLSGSLPLGSMADCELTRSGPKEKDGRCMASIGEQT
jgi:hypothetical protein